MGEYYQIIVDQDAIEEEAVALGASILQWLVSEGVVDPVPTDCVLGSDGGYPPGPNCEMAVDEKVPNLWTNGLQIVTERTVFHTMGGEIYLVCDRCGEHFEPSDEWSEAITEWHERKGPGTLRCPACGDERSIIDWQHDPPWGFGNLGFEFWNWPPLKTSFVEEVAKRLGHRVVLVGGKL